MMIYERKLYTKDQAMWHWRGLCSVVDTDRLMMMMMVNQFSKEKPLTNPINIKCHLNK